MGVMRLRGIVRRLGMMPSVMGVSVVLGDMFTIVMILRPMVLRERTRVVLMSAVLVVLTFIGGRSLVHGDISEERASVCDARRLSRSPVRALSRHP